MIIYVHIKDKVYPVSCGAGVQTIRWLGNAAIVRVDDLNFGLSTGVCEGMRLDNGKTMDINQSINEILQDRQHVWVLFEEDMEKLELKEKGSKNKKPFKK